MKIQLLCVALLFLFALPVIAEEQEQPPEFDVELIVFRHLTPDDSEPPVVRQNEEDQTPAFKRRRFSPLTTDQLRLGTVSNRLLNSRDWSPILHYGWRQPVLGREEGPAVSIAGNRRGGYVSGSVRLTVERFLRVELDLKMDPGSGIVYTLEQSRRLRSGELHYFDHPQFGVIVLVSRTD